MSKHPPIGDGTKIEAAMAVVTTNRFVKISASSERLEIRRYEDADERIDLNRVQEYCVGKADQASGWGKTDPRRGMGLKILTHPSG